MPSSILWVCMHAGYTYYTLVYVVHSLGLEDLYGCMVVSKYITSGINYPQDQWLPDGPLYITHAALFSHTTRPNVSVQCVFQNGFDLRLRPRLTNAASNQLDSLTVCLQGINLGDGPDTRLLKLNGKPYTARPGSLCRS